MRSISLAGLLLHQKPSRLVCTPPIYHRKHRIYLPASHPVTAAKNRPANAEAVVVTGLAVGLVAILLTFMLAFRIPQRNGISLQQVLNAAPQLWPTGFRDQHSGGELSLPPLNEEQERLRLTLHLMGDQAVPALLKKVSTHESPVTRWIIRPAARHFRYLRRFLPDEEDRKHAWLALVDLVMPLETRPHRSGELPVMCMLNDRSKKDIVRASIGLMQEHRDKGFVYGGITRAAIYGLLIKLPKQVEQDQQLMNNLKRWAENGPNPVDRWGARKVLATIRGLEPHVLPAWLSGEE